MAAAAAVAIPCGAAWAEPQLFASTSNESPLSITIGRFSLAAVLPQATGTNPREPLTVTLNASNGRGQLFSLANFGNLAITQFTLSQSMTNGNGAATVQTSYCAGGTAAGAFTAIDTCAGGGTLTRAVTGSQANVVTLTIPPGASRQFQMVTQTPISGQDNTATLSVQVAASGALSGTARNS
jgi:hypothetical protein